ncbi:hypothetical protein ACS0TY_026984 [Phlomoides rotata]
MKVVGNKHDVVYLLLEEIIHQTIVFIYMVIHHMEENRGSKHRCGYNYNMIERLPNQIRELIRLTGGHHSDCLDNLRVDRNAFGRLCIILRNRGGLVDGKHVTVEEQVSMFLGILGHHKKNRVVKFTFNHSGQTVSHYVHLVLTVVLQLHYVLLVRPVPIPDDSTNHRWKWFKGCLGALDGTFVNVRVSAEDRVNRQHGLKVPTGNYYLCDNGYANNSAGNEVPRLGRGSLKKPSNNTRRIWTIREEKVLINILKELVNKGWKSDNGFRTRYLNKCEDALKIDFAKTELQVSPHITSKLTAWKKAYSSLVIAHTTIGVGFNTITSQLDCTDDQWEDVVKVIHLHCY